MSAFFTDKDFLNSDVANQVLEARAIKGFAQKHRGEWSFTERQMKGDTHNALLLMLDEIEPCVHPQNKVTANDPKIIHGFICSECGVELVSLGFVEKKK